MTLHCDLSELAEKVYQHVNDRYSLPEICQKIFGEEHNELTKTREFYLVCDAVDSLIDEGLVYFRCSDGVLLDLMR